MTEWRAISRRAAPGRYGRPCRPGRRRCTPRSRVARRADYPVDTFMPRRPRVQGRSSRHTATDGHDASPPKHPTTLPWAWGGRSWRNLQVQCHHAVSNMRREDASVTRIPDPPSARGFLPLVVAVISVATLGRSPVQSCPPPAILQVLYDKTTCWRLTASAAAREHQ